MCADPEGDTGKSQVIRGSIGNEQMDPLENVGPLWNL